MPREEVMPLARRRRARIFEEISCNFEIPPDMRRPTLLRPLTTSRPLRAWQKESATQHAIPERATNPGSALVRRQNLRVTSSR